MTQEPSLSLPQPLTRHRLVFVDGAFRDALSAQKDWPEALSFGSDEKEKSYALTLCDQTCLAIDPIELLLVTTDQGAVSEELTKIKVSLGENSRLTLIERHVGSGGFLPIQKTITLAAQAKLVHGKIVKGDTVNHAAQTKVAVASGAFYDHFCLVVDGLFVRCEKTVELLGAMAETRLVEVLLLRGSAKSDSTTHVRHLAPHSISRQVCAAVLDGKAQGAFEGKVFVDQTAQKTDAYQLCRALLLSDKAMMEARPELEIYADDVKCSHGAAMGSLDENALFYLLARGLDPDAAQAMLVEAFVGEVVDAIPLPDLASVVREEVAAWLA